MKSRFSYILISVLMLGFLLAPFSPFFKISPEEVSLKIEKTYAVAQTTPAPCPVGQTQDANGNCVNDTGDSPLYDSINGCGAFGIGGNVTGCFVLILYFLFVSVPSWLMALTAQVFDFTAALTLSDEMYRAKFVNTIWTIVRDFSNIFFILILLYAAFQVILGLGHGGGKKIVASVILIALMVNFSLFISRVVVDAGNVLGLIFYNKISTDHVAYQPVSDPTLTNVKEKDLAGALISSFRINNFYTAEFLDGIPDEAGGFLGLGSRHLKPSWAVSLIVTYGLIAYSLAWIFLIVGVSFIGRMITLIMLMIVSPIAFVTATVPTFRGIDTIGFDSWLKQLFKTSFVVAVFMAILYLVSEILRANIFDSYSIGNESLGVVARLMLIFIPALLIIIFLRKGKEYAVKASGEITGALIGGAKMLGGLALGGAALGAAGVAVAGRRTVGSTMKMMSASQGTRDAALKNFNKWNPGTWGKALTAKVANQTIKGKGRGVMDAQGNTREGSNWLRDQMLGVRKSKKDKVHAEHALDDAAGKVEAGKKYSELTTDQQNQAKTSATKAEMSKFLYGEVDMSKLNPQQKHEIDISTRADGSVDHGYFDQFAYAANKDPNKFHGADHLEQNYFKPSGFGVKAAAGSAGNAAATGTYDVRNLKGGGLTAVGLAAAMFGLAPVMGTIFAAHASGGLRSGLQKLTGVDHGDSKKDFLKDLKATLDSTLKNLKFDIKVTGDGHGGGDDHSAGHGGGGGGHH
ncbi:MAG: hypothetical protein QG644_562 [Patescibacteria group bacterium]|nr:hypothetical protein [Patescibacteria group bacterium]